MRKRFKNYHRLSNEEFNSLWRECTFAFDANVILNLYRYSDKTRDELLSILGALQERIWMPYHAAAEFHRSRVKVVADHSRNYADLRAFVDKELGQLQQKFGSLYRDTGIDQEKVFGETEAALRQLSARLGELEKNSVRPTNSTDEDAIWKAVVELFDGRVGDPIDSDALRQLREEGQARYDAHVPPGFADADKGGTEQFGDLVLWKQVIQRARDLKTPMILVTDDSKEDWWWQSEGSAIGPHPALIEEITRDAHVAFWMYSSDGFIRQAARFLKRKISEQTVGEVESLQRRERKSDEALEFLRLPDLVASTPNFEAGDLVTHPRFGDGLVMSLENIEGRNVLRIGFAAGTVRRIAADSPALTKTGSVRSWRAGERVRHPKFGDGIVVSSSLIKGNEEVTVAFVGKGVKRLIAKFANLERDSPREVDD
jgi:hypothetical protein